MCEIVLCETPTGGRVQFAAALHLCVSFSQLFAAPPQTSSSIFFLKATGGIFLAVEGLEGGN